MRAVFIAGSALLVIACGSTSSTRREEVDVSVRFDSSPSGAQVYLAPAEQGSVSSADPAAFRLAGITPCTARDTLVVVTETLVRSFPPGYEAAGSSVLRGNRRWVLVRRTGYRDHRELIQLEPNGRYAFTLEVDPLASLSPVPAPGDVVAPATAAPRPKRRVPVEFTSEPDRAELSIDGEYFGTTPAWIPLDPGRHRVRVKKPGHRPWEREITIRENATQSVHASLVSGTTK